MLRRTLAQSERSAQLVPPERMGPRISIQSSPPKQPRQHHLALQEGSMRVNLAEDATHLVDAAAQSTILHSPRS